MTPQYRLLSARITVGISEIYPPDYPAHLPGNLRATAGKCPVHCPEKTAAHPL
jgi:hypothetical protein